MLFRKNKFLYGIVMPTAVAIVLFIVSFYAVIVPMFERSMMTQKEEKIIELTNAAWSVLAEYYEAQKAGNFSQAEAQQAAAQHLSKMRYGKEQKDYFWIVSEQPTMIMHPYRNDLIGDDLSSFTDEQNNKVFVEAVNLVQQQGEGSIEYFWQWKDDANRIAPKHSYVKGFTPWRWVIGTGIYLDDVEQEIAQVRKRLLTVTFSIVVIIVVILVYVLQQTLTIERKKQAAERQLRLSIQKYKSLVEASSEGTLMLLRGNISFANNKFIELLSSAHRNVLGVPFEQVFENDWQQWEAKVATPQHTYSFEGQLRHPVTGINGVILSVTQITHAGELAYIITVKQVTEHERMRLEADKLSEDVELSLQLMNQPLSNLVLPIICCNLDTSVRAAAESMSTHNSKLICVKAQGEIIGVVTDTDLRIRVLANGVASTDSVASVMSAPVVRIPHDALLYEAVLLFRKKGISHLMVENTVGQVIGCVSEKQCLAIQHNALGYLIQEIAECTLVEDLKRIYQKMPLLIQAIFTSSDNINSVCRIITSVADAISQRVIELVLLETGPVPCAFAFVAMGSEGRSEQTLKTDQDNAIIFADFSESNKHYFLNLAQKVNEHLHAVGYARCEGDLMAGNPEWCNDVKHWQQQFNQWIETTNMQQALESALFFDMRLIYGDPTLVDTLMASVHEKLQTTPEFFNLLAQTVIQPKINLDDKRIDIKRLLLPVVGYLRVSALHHQITETNSLQRLEQLVGYDHIDESRGQEIENIYNFLMHLRIKRQVALILDNDQPQNSINMHQLTELEKASLSEIVQQIQHIQQALKQEH